MENVTSGIDANGLAQLVATAYNVSATVVQVATSDVTTIDEAFGPVNVVLSGFLVNGIVYNVSSAEWVVNMKYVTDVPNAITSLYVTKAGGVGPYALSTQDTFFISKHPCLTSSSVCCLLDYRSNYNVGLFGEVRSSEQKCQASAGMILRCRTSTVLWV
eukprot:763100-Hanusia_phi.AAC.11